MHITIDNVVQHVILDSVYQDYMTHYSLISQIKAYLQKKMDSPPSNTRLQEFGPLNLKRRVSSYKSSTSTQIPDYSIMKLHRSTNWRDSMINCGPKS